MSLTTPAAGSVLDRDPARLRSLVTLENPQKRTRVRIP